MPHLNAVTPDLFYNDGGLTDVFFKGVLRGAVHLCRHRTKLDQIGPLSPRCVEGRQALFFGKTIEKNAYPISRPRKTALKKPAQQKPPDGFKPLYRLSGPGSLPCPWKKSSGPSPPSPFPPTYCA
jgi:hypothetical protein